MSEKKNIILILQQIQQGEAWHGPSIGKILESVTAEQAAARPVKGLHNIWELVLHIAAWEFAFARRLEGHRTDAPDEGDFPSVKDTSPQAWREAVKYLEDAHQKLINTISDLDESRFGETVVGKDFSVRYMLVGITQHHVYHAGQIAALKKMLS